MTVPYTYLIRHKPTGRVYYGCRYAKGCHPDELWKTYFTSSGYVKNYIEADGPNSFEYEVRRIFDNIDKCRDWENRVLVKMNVIRREIFINETTNKSISPEAASKGQKGKIGINCPAFGRKNPKLSIINTNKTGSKHHFFGKPELCPMFGKKGVLHPNFGKVMSDRGKPKETTECPHCQKIGSIANMKRWHFNNCKKKIKEE